MLSRAKTCGTIAACATMLIAGSVSAQGWVHLPGGRLGYITDYTTTGFFECGNPFYFFGSCSTANNGSVMTLGHGGNFLTLAFHGVSQTIMAGKAQSVPMGMITKSYSGPGPYTFPAGKSKNVAMFYFSVFLHTTFPIPGTGVLSRGYAGTSPTTLHPAGFRPAPNYVWFPVTPPPPPSGLSNVIYYNFTGKTMTAGPVPISMFATVSTSPEPATLWLTGSGLLGLVAFVRRRRRSQRNQACE